MASSPSATVEKAATRQRIVEAAISLFARDGIGNVPVRAITSLASVNVAAIHYHFGGTTALAEAVFNEVSARINERRTAKVSDIVEKAQSLRRKPETAEIVNVFVEPYFGDGADTEGQLLAQLILKHRISPSPMTEQIIREHFDPMARCFVTALNLSVPQIPLDQMYLRYMMMVSTVVLSVTDRGRAERLGRLSGVDAGPADRKKFCAALIEFVTGGLQAQR